jgi:hypothetical protein
MPRKAKPKAPKPKSPADIAAALAARRAETRARDRADAGRPETWGADTAALARQADVRLTGADGRRAGGQGTRRDDVFDRLQARGALSAGAHGAVRRLEADMTERRGQGHAQERGPKVDCQTSRELVTQRSLDAGDRVDRALGLVGRRDATLLRELLEPRHVLAGDGLDRWRSVVRVITGEARPEVQAGAVRGAAENLAWAYAELDRGRRRAG